VVAKQGVDLVEELNGIRWYEFIKYKNKWHPDLIIEFLVGCEIVSFIYEINNKE